MSALHSASPIVSHFIKETVIILIVWFKVDKQHEPNGRSIVKENEHVFGIPVSLFLPFDYGFPAFIHLAKSVICP